MRRPTSAPAGGNGGNAEAQPIRAVDVAPDGSGLNVQTEWTPPDARTRETADAILRAFSGATRDPEQDVFGVRIHGEPGAHDETVSAWETIFDCVFPRPF